MCSKFELYLILCSPESVHRLGFGKVHLVDLGSHGRLLFDGFDLPLFLSVDRVGLQDIGGPLQWVILFAAALIDLVCLGGAFGCTLRGALCVSLAGAGATGFSLSTGMESGVGLCRAVRFHLPAFLVVDRIG